MLSVSLERSVVGGSSVNEKTFTSSDKLILDKSASLDHHSSSFTAHSRAGRVASVSAVSLNEEALTQLDLALENEGSIGDQETQPLRSSPPTLPPPSVPETIRDNGKTTNGPLQSKPWKMLTRAAARLARK